MKISISLGLKATIVALLLFVLVSTAFNFIQLKKLEDDGRVINYTGVVRGASQKLVKLELAGRHSDKLSSRIDKIINGLIRGSEELQIPKPTDAEYISLMKEVRAAFAGMARDAIADVRAGDILAQDRLIDESEDFFELTTRAVFAAEEYGRKKVGNTRITLIGFAVLNFFILAFAWVMAGRKVITPLSNLTEKVQHIASGDLLVTIDHSSEDEMGVLAQNMNKMVRSFNSMISSILISANNMMSTVDALKTTANKTSEGSKKQSAQAAQIATASEEMSQTIVDIAKNATVASDTSGNAMEIAGKGKEVADGAVETVNRVYTSTTELASMMEKLNKRVAEVGDIVTVIKDIADQTNLLALNAAIEAARAGEQGRGFAVVADEVRKLAERTIKATAEISEKIGTVQKESVDTARAMAASSDEVTKATDYIKQVGESLGNIVEAVYKAKDQITQIATAVDEQSTASEEVTRNIEDTSIIAREMERMSDDVMHEVSELTTTAEELKNSTAGFKTE